MASEIDWSLDSYTLRKKLRILSTKRLKQLCKTRKVKYSENKSETVNRLVDSKNTDNNNANKANNITTSLQDDFKQKKQKKEKVVIKVGILGDRQVGIRSLMVTYVEDKYDEDYTDTLIVNFMEKTIHLKNVDVTISIWIGHSGWMDWMPLVCSDAQAIIFAFDLTHKMTLYSVKRYYKEARKENKTFMPFLVGTKYDLYQENDKEVNFDITRQARKYASKMHSPLIYCSSLMGINVKKIFKLIVAKVFDLKPRMKQIHSIQESIFEWNDGNKKEMICIVNGYIRSIQSQYKWKYAMPIDDFSNIVLLFYANIVIGGNNKEYKLESRTHKKMERKKRKDQRKHKKLLLKNERNANKHTDNKNNEL